MNHRKVYGMRTQCRAGAVEERWGSDKGVEVASEEGPRDTGMQGRGGLASVSRDRTSRQKKQKV